jgi:hypothetical protein
VGYGQAKVVGGEFGDDGETAVEAVQVKICLVEVADFEGGVDGA